VSSGFIEARAGTFFTSTAIRISLGFAQPATDSAYRSQTPPAAQLGRGNERKPTGSKLDRYEGEAIGEDMILCSPGPILALYLPTVKRYPQLSAIFSFSPADKSLVGMSADPNVA
jgi:hypothetical protein